MKKTLKKKSTSHTAYGAGVFALVWIFIVGAMHMVSNPESAPQQAAGAGITMVGMIFPYTVFRVIASCKSLMNQARIIELLESKSEHSETIK